MLTQRKRSRQSRERGGEAVEKREEIKKGKMGIVNACQ